MPFLKLAVSAIFGIPSVLAILAGMFGVLWGFPLIISMAFGIPVQSWGWALFGIPVVAIICFLLVVAGGIGISFTNHINSKW